MLRAKIDMASPNINLRDPAIYRIRTAHHHRTGDKWCIYPMYTYAHPIEDALENITHSLCTLEFEDQRPFYDWLLERLADGGLLARPLPQQIEFARLNLTYVVLSKRKLIQLVEEGHVDGWDDPRMPTLAGARRRGYTPEGFRLFAERIGVSKADSWIDYSMLEDCMREHLNESRRARIAVLDPVKLVIDNYPGGPAKRNATRPTIRRSPTGASAACRSRASSGSSARTSRRTPPKGYFRLFPGNRCGCATATSSSAPASRRTTAATSPPCTATTCRIPSQARPARSKCKVKGNIHWVSAGTPTRAKCGSTTVCSGCRIRAATATSSRTSIPIRSG